VAQLSTRMSAQDAFFLYFEKPQSPLHITSFGIFEGQLTLDELRQIMSERMHLVPRYRQRAVFPPLFAGHPTWADDPVFSLERHLHVIELPAPGSERQLVEAACRITQEMLPRDRPLWDMTVVNGLDGDRSATISRVHHCMIDGVSGVELALTTMDLTPEPTVVPPPAEPWRPGPLPGRVSAWNDAFFDQQLKNLRAFAELQENLLDPRRGFRWITDMVRATGTAARTGVRLPSPAPWNRPVGTKRDAAYCSMPFQEIRGIRTALGGTVNDIVLTILGGGLGRYLSARGRGRRPDLRIMIPVNVRKEGEQAALGNRVSMMMPAIPSGVADPVERLAAVRKQTERAKSSNDAGSFDMLLGLADNAPAVFGALAGRGFLPPGMVNLVCTNVPGPQIPLYSAGHRMIMSYGLLPLVGDLGIGVAVGSYAQEFGFTITVDPNIVPDVEHMRDCIVAEFRSMRDLAGVAAADLPRMEPKRVRPKRVAVPRAARSTPVVAPGVT
jgi:diacylglycerol O-acyltransferase / wax synthase